MSHTQLPGTEPAMVDQNLPSGSVTISGSGGEICTKDRSSDSSDISAAITVSPIAIDLLQNSSIGGAATSADMDNSSGSVAAVAVCEASSFDSVRSCADEAVRFKRLKLSHRRSYRSHDEVASVDSHDEVPAAGKDEDVDMGHPSTSATGTAGDTEVRLGGPCNAGSFYDSQQC